MIRLSQTCARDLMQVPQKRYITRSLDNNAAINYTTVSIIIQINFKMKIKIEFLPQEWKILHKTDFRQFGEKRQGRQSRPLYIFSVLNRKAEKYELVRRVFILTCLIPCRRAQNGGVTPLIAITSEFQFLIIGSLKTRSENHR